jgi:prevent-host-death family protein
MAMGRVVRTRGETRNYKAIVAGGLPATEAAGVISRVLLDVVSGGQPLLLTRRGRPAAVLVDPDSWAELEQLAADALVAPLAS